MVDEIEEENMGYKDKGRPERLQGKANPKKVMVACNQCIQGYHDECLGLAANYELKCLCAWNKHK